MQELMQSTLRFLRDEDGTVELEYELMAILIALAISADGFLGTGLYSVFTDICTCFDAGAGGTCPLPLPDGVTL